MKFGTLVLLSATALIAHGVQAQYSFHVTGVPSADEGVNDVFSISAEGELDFTKNSNSTGTITVTIRNTGPSTSQITGFFLLRPPSITDANANKQNPNILGSLVTPSTINGTALSGTNEWVYQNDMEGQGADGLSNFQGTWDSYQYFGARAGERLDYFSENDDPAHPDAPVVDEGVFTFSFPATVDFSLEELGAWAASRDNPHIFVRWQSIGYYDPDSGNIEDLASGKGFLWAPDDPDFEPSIPEPSEVALLSILGLGGLLWTRKRFMKKA